MCLRTRPDVARELGRELSALCAPEAEFERADEYERYQLRRCKTLGA